MLVLPVRVGLPRSRTPSGAAFLPRCNGLAAEHPRTEVPRFRRRAAVLAIYDRQNVPLREAVAKPLYRAVQDLGSRLMVQVGYAKLPSYQEQIAAIIERNFETRRKFCEATGLSEDMLSHVLKGRKDVHRAGQRIP